MALQVEKSAIEKKKKTQNRQWAAGESLSAVREEFSGEVTFKLQL